MTIHTNNSMPFIVLHLKSFMSVVFDFSAPLSDDLPVSLMSLPVDLMRNGKEWIADGCHLCAVSLCSPAR